jgi:hypothetical protein
LTQGGGGSAEARTSSGGRSEPVDLEIDLEGRETGERESRPVGRASSGSVDLAGGLENSLPYSREVSQLTPARGEGQSTPGREELHPGVTCPGVGGEGEPVVRQGRSDQLTPSRTARKTASQLSLLRDGSQFDPVVDV